MGAVGTGVAVGLWVLVGVIDGEIDGMLVGCGTGLGVGTGIDVGGSVPSCVSVKNGSLSGICRIISRSSKINVAGSTNTSQVRAIAGRTSDSNTTPIKATRDHAAGRFLLSIPFTMMKSKWGSCLFYSRVETATW